MEFKYPNERLRGAGILALALLFTSGVAFGQGAQTGNIFAKATDEQGAGLPGVGVTLTGVSAPVTQVTNINGDVRFLNLSPATYTLDFALSGFGKVSRKNVSVAVNQNTQIDVTMNGKAGFRMHNSAECVMENINPSNSYVKVNVGFLLVNMKPLDRGDTFDFETPNAVISVKGTQFSIRVEKKGQPTAMTTVVVRNGSVQVRVKASSATITVLEGQTLELPPNTYIPSQRTATEEETAPLERISAVYIAT